MSGVSKFVKQRNGPGSPHNATVAQPTDPTRQARAANAKVSVKRRPAPQNPQQVHPSSAIPTRGVRQLQNSAAFIQHEPQRRHSGPGFKHDPYDTDAESIDTTVNESVIQAEGFQITDAQYQKVVNDYAGLDQDEGESEDEEEYRRDDTSNRPLTQPEVDYLHSMGMQNLFPAEAIAFLHDAHPGKLPTIEGDSYPPTTNGDPSEWEGVKDSPPFESIDEDNVISSSPKRPNANCEPSYAPPPKDRGYRGGTGLVSGFPLDPIFKQSANLRGQQRGVLHQDQKPSHGHKGSTALIHPSEPVLHSQASRKTGQAQPIDPQARQDFQATFQQSHQHVERRRSGPARVALDPPKSLNVHVPASRLSSADILVVPTIQHVPTQPQQIESGDVHLHGDYDLSILQTMSYDQLKNESFDTNPRAKYPSLSVETPKKPLAERLVQAQKNGESAAQAHFFQSLPTSEWEEAGDWFLDRFSNIIRQTKEARQKKRKFAQDFEVEVERRHKRVSKKQHQVENAMSRMKAQGESLVPKSPRSKTAHSDI